MKKKIVSISLILCLIIGCLPVTSLGASNFSDLDESHWAHEKIMQAVDAGVFTGTNANTFSPGTTMTRAMFVSALMRMEGGTPGSETTFTDVPQDSWYMGAVAWAHANGVADGISPTEFAPDAAVNREQAASLLTRAFRITEPSAIDSAVFEDGAEISNWALPQVLSMREKGYLNGYPDGTFRPKAELTRAEAAVLFAQFLNGSENSGVNNDPEDGKTYYTVTFESNSGTKIDPARIEEGKAAIKPSNPTRSGYTFEDWYTEAALTNKYDFSKPVTENVTLYASWTAAATAGSSGGSSGGGGGGGGGSGGGGGDPQPTVYTITFEANGGSTVNAQSIESGKTVTRPSDPAKTGYEFTGWYKEAALSTLWNFSSDTVTENITLYAGWKAVLNGSGTESDPYLIYSEENLKTIINKSAAYYKLMADIEVSDWVAIDLFSGVFEGNGKSITLLEEVKSNGSSYGFIGTLSGVVKNLSVKGSAALNSDAGIGDIALGGIAGVNTGTILNCFSSIDLKVTGSRRAYAGGIVGHNAGNISDSYSVGSVSIISGEESFAGGIVGYIEDEFTSHIDNCYSKSSVFSEGSKNQYAGGIAGYSGTSDLMASIYIRNTVALNENIQLGNGAGTSAIARIANNNRSGYINNWALALENLSEGEMNDSNGKTIPKGNQEKKDFYVETMKWSFGGSSTNPWVWDTDKNQPILWYQTEDAVSGYTVTFNFNNGYSESIKLKYGEKVVEPEKVIREGYKFLGWYKDNQLKNIWKFDTDLVVSETVLFAGWKVDLDGRGTEDDPFLINNADDLLTVNKLNQTASNERANITFHYKLMQDIEVSNWVSSNIRGTFNGNGHAITINSLADWEDLNSVAVGLFAYSSAHIFDLEVKGNLSINTKTWNDDEFYIGAIAGQSLGKIENCKSTVTIAVEDEINAVYYIGGMTGINWDTIENCYFDGNLETNGGKEIYIGGLSGFAYEASILNSYASGTLSAEGPARTYVGGIASSVMGRLPYYDYTIGNCLSAIDIKGEATQLYRIAENNKANLSNNWALDFGVEYEDDENGPDGATIGVDAKNTKEFYEDVLKWNFGENSNAPWAWDALNSRPVLWYQSESIDDEVQEITLEIDQENNEYNLISDEELADGQPETTIDEKLIDSEKIPADIAEESIAPNEPEDLVLQ